MSLGLRIEVRLEGEWGETEKRFFITGEKRQLQGHYQRAYSLHSS